MHLIINVMESKPNHTIKMSHDYLVKLAGKWLKNHYENLIVPNCPIVAEELVTSARSGEQPDVIGFNHCTSVLLEIKVSRKDFCKDKTKLFRQEPELGVGQLRYYVVPDRLVGRYEIPENWGLIYCTGKKLKIVKEAKKQPFDCLGERAMLMSIIRRQKRDFKNAIKNLK